MLLQSLIPREQPFEYQHLAVGGLAPLGLKLVKVIVDDAADTALIPRDHNVMKSELLYVGADRHGNRTLWHASTIKATEAVVLNVVSREHELLHILIWRRFVLILAQERRHAEVCDQVVVSLKR